jgi:hypothetical protein
LETRQEVLSQSPVLALAMNGAPAPCPKHPHHSAPHDYYYYYFALPCVILCCTSAHTVSHLAVLILTPAAPADRLSLADVHVSRLRHPLLPLPPHPPLTGHLSRPPRLPTPAEAAPAIPLSAPASADTPPLPHLPCPPCFPNVSFPAPHHAHVTPPSASLLGLLGLLLGSCD